MVAKYTLDGSRPPKELVQALDQRIQSMADALAPSPWFTLPVSVLHHPHGVAADVVARSRGLTFAPIDPEIDRSISKGIAAVHETYRRIRRGEFVHSQTLLDELRYHIVLADDWVNDRAPRGVALARYELRASGLNRGIELQSYVEGVEESRGDGGLMRTGWTGIGRTRYWVTRRRARAS